MDKVNRAGKGRTVIDLLMASLAGLSGMAVAYVLASLFHTQTVLATLSTVGVSVPLSDRIEMSWFDMQGLWRYGLTIAVAMTLGFLIMSVVTRRLRMPRWLRLSVAGFVAFATMLLAMKAALSFTPVASARSTSGFLLQCCAGGVGGAVAGLNLTIWKNFDSIKAKVNARGR